MIDVFNRKNKGNVLSKLEKWGHLFTRAYVVYQYTTAICNQKYCNSKREMRLSSSVKAMRMYLPLSKDLYLQLLHEL